MSSGIAEAGQRWKQADKPTPLPVQALDHATGYLMAASVIRLLTERLRSGRGGSTRLSLARTAKLLVEHGAGTDEALRPEEAKDQSLQMEHTPWGPARRLQAPLRIAGAPLQWALPATELGSHRPQWF
jgi:crotonobetainyl-CoA:carnitine CoA-transferase CaiB-like acyl-CoA transferase